MTFTPTSAVYLLDIPLDNTNKNQLYFDTANEQYTYFLSRVKKVFAQVTHIRKDNKIRVQEEIDNLWNCNYVMYQNDSISNKRFYCFITKIEYVNENTTDLYIETDVFQTWLFDITINKSFVVREHVRNDTIGTNLVDESLDTGEYKLENYTPVNKMGAPWNILAVSDNTPLGDNTLSGNKYGNVISGLTYYPFPNTTAGLTWLKDTIALYDAAGKHEAITMIFTVPQLIINSSVSGGYTLGTPLDSGSSFDFEYFTLTTKSLNGLDGYIPKNNKLYNYPYKFLYVSNSTGGNATYRYEDFNSNNIDFTIFGSLYPDPDIMLAPRGYKGGLESEVKYEYGLMLKGFPLGSWTSDSYNAWLANNAGASTVGIVAGVGAGIVGALTGNLAAGAGGALAVFNQLHQWYQASIQPDQAKGQAGAGNLQFGRAGLDFYFSHMTIKAEYAKRIDDFLTMYGYKVNSLKVPELHSRRYWNYIETIDINIVGAIPADDMKKVKDIFNSGVTLWHSPDNIFNYNLANTII